MNGLEIYNEILQNTHNLKGTWEVTEENYLKVDGMTNGSIVLFDQTVGALGDFILEWTAEQKGGSYIHSNLCPSLRYTPEDAGIEGGGDNYAVLVYLCNYGGNTGTIDLRTDGGTKSSVSASTSLNIDTVYTFRFERLNGVYNLYQDGVLINSATDITKKKLYLGWYLWYGGSNASYQTNFILREYKLTKVDTKSFLDTIGLTTLWSKIKSLFATKAELGAKANDNDVVHKSGNETIEGNKAFRNIKLVGNTDLITNTDDSTYTNIVGGTSSSTSAFLQLVGGTWSYEPNRGMFILGANNGTTRCNLQGKPDGTLSWSGTVIKTNTFEGNLASFYKFANNDLYRNVDNGYLALGGGSKFSSSSLLILGGIDNSSYTGQAIINIKNSSNSYNLTAKCDDTTLSKNGTLYWGGTVIYGPDNTCDLGNSNKRFKDIYATNATINTSDRNAKQDISVIDDKLLDAWGNVNPVTFRLISSVEQKGDNARVHTGYIAQNVKEELNKYGIDACKYGLFCYNSWDAQEEKSHEEKRTDEEGNPETIKVIDTPAREAGETYGLRYIECLVVECAYLRKKNKELEDRITKLEENLNA